ncbi:Rieske 2Fe-2S domain-containing protein [Aestuariivivens sediminis]|uniref:Rieske 2Fe-2S domain-containing protein n=1 Tax=Aestuariivivens sediminis TaxID=2913557 RepID=UPI0021D44A96|nr:Rieske 2Fe-2S domain-containing protein [Aestuariivivens sediminis]
MRDQWYPISLLNKLSKRPKRFFLLGEAIVVYKGEFGWVAQKDSCPHRNYPLSKGKVINGKLVCGYHGWQFNNKGFVTKLPGLKKKYKGKTCMLSTYGTYEHNGLLWVCLAGMLPFHNHLKPLPYSKVFSYRTTIIGNTADILENFLDPMHTSFLHDGLIRNSSKPRKTIAEIRGIKNGVEVRYTEESHQSGVIGSVFGRFITHSYGRLTKGNIIDLEFHSKKGIEMTNRFIIVPTKTGENYFFSQITASNRWLPSWVKISVLGPLFLLALRQDKKAIRAIYDNGYYYKDPRLQSTYLDIMRPYIDLIMAGKELTINNKNLELYI